MTRSIQLIGVPSDYGADRRGVDMGPSAIRYAGLADELQAAGIECIDGGDLTVPRAEERDPDANQRFGDKAKFLPETAQVCSRLAEEVATALEADRLPLVLGGDHSIAIGTLNGVARDADVGVLWFDAHGDANTPETSPSGNVHGMTLAAVLGWGDFADLDWAHAPNIAEENVVWVGLRDLDPGERKMVQASDATAYTMSDIDERGISAVVDEALDTAIAGVDALHVSLDLDFLDPNEAPGVGTPVKGGATYREAHSALEAVADRDDEQDLLRSLELVEVNPILDESNETGRLATELAASALGRRIL